MPWTWINIDQGRSQWKCPRSMAMAAISSVGIMCVTLMALGVMAQGPWDTADATFYGDMSGSQTMGGTCGYGDLFAQGYGLENTAVSGVLFNNGEICGACYEVQCINDTTQRCSPGSITVTVTSLCPPDPKLPGGGLCNNRKHFDMSMAMYVKIAKSAYSGSIPIQFRRVPCVKKGGMRFQIKGNPFWIEVLVYNVGGSGDVAAVSVKGANSAEWMPMTRLWGQNWQVTGTPSLVGQSLSFQVTTGDGKMVQSDDVAPVNWEFGQIYEGQQF